MIFRIFLQIAGIVTIGRLAYLYLHPSGSEVLTAPVVVITFALAVINEVRENGWEL